MRVRHFVSWLAVSGRLTATPEQMADYIVVDRPFLGDLARRHHPALAAAFATTAEGLGFAPTTITSQWSDVVKAAIVQGLRVDQLSVDSFNAGRVALLAATQRHCPATGHRSSLSKTFYGAEATLFHLGVFATAPPRRHTSLSVTNAAGRTAQWESVPQQLRETLCHYIEQARLTRRPATVCRFETTLREFACFLAATAPEVDCAAAIRRYHIEAYKLHLGSRASLRPSGPGQSGLSKGSLAAHLSVIRTAFARLGEWGGDDRPSGPLLFAGHSPILDKPLPRFLDDAASAKLLIAARAHPEPFVRLCVEILARTGMRKGEFAGLTIDAVVQIGSAYWLRVPVGKMHTDRYIPLHPQLKAMIDDELARRPEGLHSDLLFLEHGRPITGSKIETAVDKAALAAGLGPINPHRLRHTLATQAINRGMAMRS